MKNQPNSGKEVPLVVMQCETCQATVAILICADAAKDASGLEEYAHLMASFVDGWKVSTWVIGPPSAEGHPSKQPLDIMKLWPKREPAFQACRDDLYHTIEQLTTTHC